MTLTTMILAIGGVIALVMLIAGVIISTRSERSLVEDRLGRYLEDEIQAQAKQDASGEAASPLTDWFNVQVERSSWGENISRDLARADLKLRPGEYIGIQLISAIGVGALFWFLGGQNILFAAIGLVIGIIIPRYFVRSQQGKRLVRFSDQLPDMLNLMVNGLRAGYSTMQALEAVSKELPSPISDEFRRVVQEMQLGVPMERALDNLYRRVPSDDLDLVITAVNVQREVGGNLAEILDTISYTIRERIRIKGEIRVLTAQVMYSGRFLAVLPIILSLILWVVNRPYMMKFFEPQSRLCGLGMLGCGGSMIIAGFFVMNKIADIDV
jgi:tight adherence protein B